MGTMHSRTRSSRARRWVNGWAGILSAEMKQRVVAVGLMLGIVALGVTLGVTPALPQSAVSCPPFVCTSFVATLDPSGDPPLFSVTEPAGINSRGQIVGFMRARGMSHGFIRDAQGNFTRLDYRRPGFTSGFTTFPVGINDSGQVVLIVLTPGNSLLGSFLAQPPYSDTSFTPITVTVSGKDPGGTGEKPVAVDTVVAGINSRGQIVGTYSDLTGFHSFLLDPSGHVTTIDLQAGCARFQPTGINEPGQVVGYAGRQALLYAQGACTTIDLPASAGSTFTQTQPTGINNRGEVIGWYGDASWNQHWFLLHRDGSVDTIDLPLIHLSGINERGQITGWFFNNNNFANDGLIVSGH